MNLELEPKKSFPWKTVGLWAVLTILAGVPILEAVAPYGFKGLFQTATQYSNVLQFPNAQVTKMSGINSLVETGNTNLLVNPSFEAATATTGWTTANGSPGAELTVVSMGKKSLVTSPSATTFSVQQSSTINAAQMAGVQFLAMVRVRTNQSGVQVCSVNDGTVSTVNCASVNNDSNWGLYKVPFVGTTTSNGIWIGSTASTTGNIYIDDAFVGPADLKVDAPQILTQTSSLNAASTGPSVILTGTPTNQGVTTLLSFSAGTWTALKDLTVVATCRTTNNAAATTQPTILTNGSSTGLFGNTVNVSGQAISTAWSGILTTGQTIACRNDSSTASGGTVVINAQNIVNTQIYTAQNGDTGWLSCGMTASDFTGFGTPTSINLLCKRQGSDLLIKGTFVCGTTTAVEARIALRFNGQVLTSTTIPVREVSGTYIRSVSGTAKGGVGLTDGAKTYLNFGDSATIGSGSVNGFATTTGTNVCNAADLMGIGIQRIPIEGWQNSYIIIGSFNEVMTAPGISKPKTCYYAFGGASATLASPTECTAGACVEVYDSCGTGTPPSWQTVALYNNLTFASGTFANSTPVQCSCVGFDVTASTIRACTMYFDTSDQSWSSNSSGGYVTNMVTATTSGTESTTYVSVKCEGTAP